MKNQVVQLESVNVNLSPFGFHLWAEDYLIAERAYATVTRLGSVVGHFLCCQSVELSLKAFLLLKGMKRSELRKRSLGHNLSALFAQAIDRGLGDLVSVDDKDASLLQVATDWYDSPEGKRLQYFKVIDAMRGFRGVPDLAGLEALATRLQSPALRDAVENA